MPGNMPGSAVRLKNFHFRSMTGKELLGPADRFGQPEQQEAMRLQRVVKQRQEFVLGLGFQIDEEIAAGEEVQFGKRRIYQHVMCRKYHQVPNLLFDPVTVILLGEKSLQSFRRDVPGDANWIEAVAGCLNEPGCLYPMQTAAQ